MEDRDPTTPFITAVLAERDKRAEEGDISPFPKLWLQPDLPPPIPDETSQAFAELRRLEDRLRAIRAIRADIVGQDGQ